MINLIKIVNKNTRSIERRQSKEQFFLNDWHKFTEEKRKKRTEAKIGADRRKGEKAFEESERGGGKSSGA